MERAINFSNSNENKGNLNIERNSQNNFVVQNNLNIGFNENLYTPQKIEAKSEKIEQNYVKAIKTLVLDLDETLIHSSPFPLYKYDILKTVLLFRF